MGTENEKPTAKNEILNHEAKDFPIGCGIEGEYMEEVINDMMNISNTRKTKELEIWFKKYSKKEIAIAFQYLRHRMKCMEFDQQLEHMMSRFIPEN